MKPPVPIPLMPEPVLVQQCCTLFRFRVFESPLDKDSPKLHLLMHLLGKTMAPCNSLPMIPTCVPHTREHSHNSSFCAHTLTLSAQVLEPPLNPPHTLDSLISPPKGSHTLMWGHHLQPQIDCASSYVSGEWCVLLLEINAASFK